MTNRNLDEIYASTHGLFFSSSIWNIWWRKSL